MRKEKATKGCTDFQLVRFLEFARDVHDSVALLWKSAFYTPASILVRPLFEHSIYLLWASRRPDGWLSLCERWRANDEELARKSAKLPALANIAQEKVSSANKIKGFKQAPNLLAAIKDVFRLDAEEPNIPMDVHDRTNSMEIEQAAEERYRIVFGFGSRAVHAHGLVIIRPARPDATIQTAIELAEGAFYLCRAVHYFNSWTTDELIQDFEQAMKPAHAVIDEVRKAVTDNIKRYS